MTSAATTPTERTPLGLSRESLLRFDLAVQRNHLVVYAVGFLLAMIGRLLGVFPLRIVPAIAICGFACLLSVIYYYLVARGFDRRILNPLWVTTDIAVVSIGVYASGGINSPWYIWYIATASAAAFAIGKNAAYVASLANTVAYITVLMLMGQVSFFDEALFVALTRMLFLFGASWYFLIGIIDLTEKRLRIKQLELAESRKVEELTQLMAELRARSAELAAVNDRLQDADRLKSQFLANMSHELRTPMNSIIGFSELLVERLAGKVEPKHLSFLNHILASGQHLLGIINDILDLSKIEAGKMEIYAEFFDIKPVVESVCHVMRGMARNNPPSFAIDVPTDLPQIETDLAKFKQVLFNLISNAVKFSPPATPISIRARYIGTNGQDGDITVSVSDQGIGIDPKHHALIFEEFRQIDGTVKREFGGTGLGLALVKKFVELQGGRVTLESEPGRGSTFSFTLPVHTRAAVVSRAPELEQRSDQLDRVLVVEDDANAYELIAAALGSAGYVSIRARHGEEAIKLARESRPVAVTLDLVLPGLDGWDVLKRLKADPETRDIPVVIISMVDNRDLGVALGADDYFVKPVDRDRLVERIRQIAAGDDGTKPRLLLIDDDAAVHALLDEELSTLGYAIQSAYSGEEGLRCASENAPDLIILDLMMPGMSGFEVAQALKENPLTANIPILVLTSKEISADDRDELQSKVTTFVQKGKSARDQLVREIRRLEQRRVIQ